MMPLSKEGFISVRFVREEANGIDKCRSMLVHLHSKISKSR